MIGEAYFVLCLVFYRDEVQAICSALERGEMKLAIDSLQALLDEIEAEINDAEEDPAFWNEAIEVSHN